MDEGPSFSVLTAMTAVAAPIVGRLTYCLQLASPKQSSLSKKQTKKRKHSHPQPVVGTETTTTACVGWILETTTAITTNACSSSTNTPTNGGSGDLPQQCNTCSYLLSLSYHAARQLNEIVVCRTTNGNPASLQDVIIRVDQYTAIPLSPQQQQGQAMMMMTRE